jgi:hypothetical protein
VETITAAVREHEGVAVAESDRSSKIADAALGLRCEAAAADRAAASAPQAGDGEFPRSWNGGYRGSSAAIYDSQTPRS